MSSGGPIRPSERRSDRAAISHGGLADRCSQVVTNPVGLRFGQAGPAASAELKVCQYRGVIAETAFEQRLEVFAMAPVHV